MKKYFLLKTILFVAALNFIFTYNGFAQCCAGSSGCSISGGASTGVLPEGQFELSTKLQFIKANKFYQNEKLAPDSVRTFDSYNSSYQYFKIGYGITKNFTLSVENGYYFKKEEVGLNENPATTYKSNGIGDLILFPRYDVLNKAHGNIHNEITIGTGFKIPLGSYNDSIGSVEPFSGKTFYVVKPTAVQLSSGAHDIIFYTFLYRGWVRQNFKLFANAFYIKKGYNANGEKLGDYASVALFLTILGLYYRRVTNMLVE